MAEEGIAYPNLSQEEYLPMALMFYKRGCRIIEATLDEDVTKRDQHSYVWPGMQTFHYCFYLAIAGIHRKLGREDEVRPAVLEAYRIISESWDDFAERRDYYMEPFFTYLTQNGLDDFAPEF